MSPLPYFVPRAFAPERERQKSHGNCMDSISLLPLPSLPIVLDKNGERKGGVSLLPTVTSFMIVTKSR